MNIYSIISLLDVFNKIQKPSTSFPFLESFYRKYSQKVTEDRKVPLFSKTTKYNNFPVRCQWKTNVNNNKNKWRKNKITQKMAPTKIKKIKGIKGSVITILNKITDNNVEKQSDNLLKYLNDNQSSDSGYIIANLILEKVWYDKGFYELYIKLCKKLWDNSEWLNETYNIFEKNNKFYYTIYDTIQNSIVGKFENSFVASNEVKKIINFKNIFLSICKDNFYKRHLFIEKLKKLPDCNKKYILKRRLFGTVQILGYMYKLKHIGEDIIHYLLVTMFNKEEGVSTIEELEAIKLLWDIVFSHIKEETMKEYIPLIEKELKKDWCIRIKFMCEDMRNSFKENKFVKKIKLNQSKENIINNIIKLSRNNKKDKIKTMLKNISSNFYEDILIETIKDSIEYNNFIDRHLRFFNYFINYFKVSNVLLSNVITNVFSDLLEIKLDAPKASNNLKFFLSKINNNITVNLNNIEYDYYEPEEIKKECIYVTNTLKNIKIIHK